VLARRLAFRAFVAWDTTAFLCPIVAIWRRARWRGLINVHRSPTGSSLEEFFCLFITSFMLKNLMGSLFAVLISVTFVVSIALNIVLPEY
jgi:hypothetical protein